MPQKSPAVATSTKRSPHQKNKAGIAKIRNIPINAPALVATGVSGVEDRLFPFISAV